MIHDLNSNKFRLFIAATTIALASACSSSDAPSKDIATTTDGENTGSETPATNPSNGNDSVGPTSGDFDLSEYMFHGNVLVNGGEISFDEKIYGKDDSEGGSFITLKRSFVNNNGTIEEYSSDDRIKTFTIGETVINENLLDPVDSRTTNRFANIGDTYMDASSTPPATSVFPVEQNATCVLEEHLPTFDLATATTGITLASGVHEDVIRVQCVTSFVSGTTKTAHTTLNSYFAKGVGVIFNEGNMLLLEDVYIVEEY